MINYLFLVTIISLISLINCGRQHQKTFKNDDNQELLLKWTVFSDRIDFEIVAETTGFVGFGFSHFVDNGLEEAIYDSFLGGVKNGADYGASYALKSGRMTRQKENRYEV